MWNIQFNTVGIFQHYLHLLIVDSSRLNYFGSSWAVFFIILKTFGMWVSKGLNLLHSLSDYPTKSTIIYIHPSPHHKYRTTGKILYKVVKRWFVTCQGKIYIPGCMQHAKMYTLSNVVFICVVSSAFVFSLFIYIFPYLLYMYTFCSSSVFNSLLTDEVKRGER